MTSHLYYTDSFLYEFDAEVVESIPSNESETRPAVILDRTAFYPTSGGQIFDTGSLISLDSPAAEAKVVDTTEREDGAILHFVGDLAWIREGSRVHGVINAQRRRDHMQQHSGQHVLSAAFVRLFDMPTLSFHMGDDYCSIDLETKNLVTDQVEAAERLANEVILENRMVEICFVTQDEARGLGLRKLPPAERGELRLIDIRDFDLTACGGTHVKTTGQIGCILLRKTEKVRQGMRVEFVCGQRAVRTARLDYTTLAEAASLYSTHIWDLPQQLRKVQDEAKVARRLREEMLEELAEQLAARMLSGVAASSGRKIINQVFENRDLSFIKMLAQKLTRLEPNVVALLGSRCGQPSLVFAQSAGQPFDMGSLMKDALARLGGRGGGSKDMAQGGPQRLDQIESVLKRLVASVEGVGPHEH
jgi:alanyl-tRNA synthetase